MIPSQKRNSSRRAISLIMKIINVQLFQKLFKQCLAYPAVTKSATRCFATAANPASVSRCDRMPPCAAARSGVIPVLRVESSPDTV